MYNFKKNCKTAIEQLEALTMSLGKRSTCNCTCTFTCTSTSTSTSTFT